MKFANDPLWQKIDSFPLNNPAFTQKLAKENNWDPGFTERAIREYKRFIYLCCTMPNGASPPPVVDEVWHLHILYTVNYWEEFCEQTLGRKLHHHPSKEGPEEKERHVNWLAETIKNYRYIFEEEPPEDIWGISVTQPPVKKLSLVKKILIGFGVFAGLFLFIGKAAFVVLLVVGACMMLIPDKKTSTDTGGGGSGCGSSCSSGDGGGCGGGCGGCGGD